MKVGMLVLGSPLKTQACHTAVDLTEQFIKQGHQIHRVFFFSDAVLIGSTTNSKLDGLHELQEKWSSLASKHDLDLTVCITASTRRGLIEKDIEQSVVEGFSVSGLGQLIEASLVCDRLVTLR